MSAAPPSIAFPLGIRMALRHAPALAMRSAAARLSAKLPVFAHQTQIEGYSIGHKQTAIYETADPDTLCVFGVSPVAAEAAVYCKQHARRFVLMLGSDEDLSSHYYPGSRETNAYGAPGGLCNFALTSADIVVTQTEAQQRLLAERFGISGAMVRNPVDLSPLVGAPAKGVDVGVLWVGKSDTIKRPEIVVNIARSFPEQKFTLVMNVSDRSLHARIASAIPANVELLERISLDDADRLFSKATVLVNTSVFEGFPNTFLQAGRFAVPILSLCIDPDRMLEASGCGIVANGDVALLERHLRHVCADQALARDLGLRARAYVERFHALPARAAELAALLRDDRRPGALRIKGEKCVA